MPVVVWESSWISALWASFRHHPHAFELSTDLTKCLWVSAILPWRWFVLRLKKPLISSSFSVLFLCSLQTLPRLFFCARRCSVCCDHLTNWYYEKDGKLYCRKHYWEKFGELCHGCSLLMTGPAMVSLLHLWFNTPSISSYTLYVFMSEEF